MADRENLNAEYWLPILLEEYRQVYALALFRLDALDQRVPLAGGVIATMLGTVGVLPEPVQIALLLALPFSLLWLLRTTINHARSFEDCLRRIELIEQEVNRQAGHIVLDFQSSHPSRGSQVGGRTGTETVESVMAAAAVLLGSCLYLFHAMLSSSAWEYTAYAATITLFAASLLAVRRRLWSYSYRRTMRGDQEQPRT